MADYGRYAWWSIDHDRGARASLTQAKKFLLSQFLFSAPRCCGFVTSRSQLRFVAVVGENLCFFFQAVTCRCAPPFGAFFLLVLGLKKKAPKRMVLKIDRRVGGSFFFLFSPLELPAIRLEGLLLLTPSLVGLLLQYTRNPQQTGRKRKRSSTHRRSPATNKVVEILILGTYLLLDRSFDYLRASPSNSRDTPLWSYDFAFLEKALKKWRKLPPHRNKRPKTKNKRTFLESIWLCHVASHTAAQQTILPTWLDNVVSRIDVAAAASISRHAGHTCFCSRHMQSWTWRQNQSPRNLNNFCRAPFRISGHIRWPITPLFFGIFLSFFHSMLSFHYFTSMRGKNLKVLCFKTAIWRTLIAIDRNGFRRMKEEGQIYKPLPRMF